MVEDRRKHRRTKRRIPLKIADKTYDIITDTVDLSPTGTNCRINRLLLVMSKIEIILLVPIKGNGSRTKKMRCKGVVVRSDPVILENTEKPHYNIAIFFTEISEKDQETIASYIDSVTKDEEAPLDKQMKTRIGPRKWEQSRHPSL